MTKIILHGCSGYMGKVITGIASQDPEIEIAAGIDITDNGEQDYPVYSSLSQCSEDADVIVDFSTARAVDALLSHCAEKKIPVVLCTTGLSEEQLARVQEVSRETAVLKSANMSLGINVLLKLIRDAAKVLQPAGFDMEIVERHHSRKLDAPSGTAIALADSLNEAMDHEFHYVYDRSGRREKRDPKEIGISAVRGGSIVGNHEVIFAGTDEVIEFKHTAFSRAIFAKGALEAARFLCGKPAGLYDMSDVIEDSLSHKQP